MDDDLEWVEEEHIPSVLRAKVLSLKVCRNRCLAHATSESASDIAKPVLKMFITLLEFSGSLRENNNDE